MQPCDQLFHLSLALEPGCVQDLSVVLLSEMCSKESNRRQIYRSLLEHLEYDREPSSYPGGFDTPIGCVLGEVEHLCAYISWRF